MKKNVLSEIQDMKYLFNYNRGRILSEQELYNGEKIDLDEYQLDDDLEMTDYGDDNVTYDELYKEVFEDLDVPVMLPGTKEKERTITIPGTKPGTKPDTPYKPKPGPKKNPKAEKGEMPDWLSFDEIGIQID